MFLLFDFPFVEYETLIVNCKKIVHYQLILIYLIPIIICFDLGLNI